MSYDIESISLVWQSEKKLALRSSKDSYYMIAPSSYAYAGRIVKGAIFPENIINFSEKIHQDINNYSIQQMTASRQVAKETVGENRIVHYLNYEEDYDKVRSYELSLFKKLKNKLPFTKNV